MIENIIIENFRGIKHIQIEDTKQFNLLVGRNNSCKTTILEALFLLIGATNPLLPLNINNFRGCKNINNDFFIWFFYNLDINNSITISSQINNSKGNRKLVIQANKEVISSKTTRISVEKEDIQKQIKASSYSGAEPVINGLILEFFPKYTKKSKPVIAKIISGNQSLELSSPAGYKESLQGIFLKQENIFSDIGMRFNNIQVKKGINRIIKILQKIEPSLVNLSLGVDNTIYCDTGLDRLVPINIMGDGIYRLLSIILSISDALGGIVLIDEVENGFHHSSQEILWSAIFEAGKEYDVQIFATTHSLECVKAFSNMYYEADPGEDSIKLYRIEKNKDKFKVIHYEPDLLANSLEDNWEVR